MPKTSSKKSRLLLQRQETAACLNRSGLVSKPNMPRVQALFTTPPEYTPERVVFVRTNVARLSRVAFASFMNVSVSTIRRWESPVAGQHPAGAAARLLQLVEAKGIETLLLA